MNSKIEALLPYVQKPARYTGAELNSVVKNKEEISLRYAFCFPDTYEIGMSHLGLKILYYLANQRQDTWCERVFAPWDDMENAMRKNDIELFSLESGDSIKDFDIIGFTLQYELCYTNVLNMLDLSGLPVKSADRKELLPLVIAGGPCACNPEPIADFIDLFVLGEGEEVSDELLDILKECKQSNSSKLDFLKKACKIQGVYVPAFYDVAYNKDSTIESIKPKYNAPEKVKKRIISDFDNAGYPDSFPVPFIEIVHDRAVGEVFRGCIRGCRFCQAGYIYRPIREKSAETVNKQSKALCESTGYDEISLCSLSTSDYSSLAPLLEKLLDWTVDDNVNIALPSLRADNFPEDLMKKLYSVRRSGLTFAPEAGTQRLRDVINKNITQQEILEASRKAFSGGWTAVKLYFMLGLPTETEEDISGIAQLSQMVVEEYYNNPDKPKGKSVNVSVSVSNFIPKAHTPFQWEPQDTMEQIKQKQDLLKGLVTTRKVSLSFHNIQMSHLEAVFARGDRRLCPVIEEAWKNGCSFDSWDDKFKFDVWMQSFEKHKVSPEFYTSRKRDFAEVLPYDHLDYGVKRSFLVSENILAHQGISRENCRDKCASCGANLLNGGKCDAIS